MTLLAPTTCYISDFSYRWPEVSSISWPLYYKSMEKYWNPSHSQNTLQKSRIPSESCYHRPFLTIHMQFLIGDPSEGHLRSPRVNNGFLPITGDRKEIETWEWSHCVCLIETHWFICNVTYLGHHMTLNGQIWSLTFKGHLIHFSMRVDEANTMVSKSLLCLVQTWKLLKNCFAQKCHFDLSWPLTPKRLILGEIRGQVSERTF